MRGDICKYCYINEALAKTEAFVLSESEKLHVRSKLPLPHAQKRNKNKSWCATINWLGSFTVFMCVILLQITEVN